MRSALSQNKDSDQIFKTTETKSLKDQVSCKAVVEETKQGTPKNVESNINIYRIHT